MSDGSVPGGCILECFVVDLGCLVCRLEDLRALGVILGGGEKWACPSCMVCVC